MDADEADLAREFSGSVTLTVHDQEEVTLSPDQARPAPPARQPARPLPQTNTQRQCLSIADLSVSEACSVHMHMHPCMVGQCIGGQCSGHVCPGEAIHIVLSGRAGAWRLLPRPSI